MTKQLLYPILEAQTNAVGPEKEIRINETNMIKCRKSEELVDYLLKLMSDPSKVLAVKCVYFCGPAVTIRKQNLNLTSITTPLEMIM